MSAQRADQAEARTAQSRLRGFFAGLMQVPRFSLALVVQVFALAIAIACYQIWAGLAEYIERAFGNALMMSFFIAILFWLPTLIVLIRIQKARPAFLIAGCAIASVPPYFIGAPIYAQYWYVELLVYLLVGTLLGSLFCLVAFSRRAPTSAVLSPNEIPTEER